MFVDDPRVIPETRRLCEKLAARGWLTMAWPREYGGQDASVWKQAILREEMWAHDEPRGPQYMNLNYIGPCIMRFGTAEQKRRFLPPMAAGRVLWTQGFSEPDAGSDLAVAHDARRGSRRPLRRQRTEDLEQLRRRPGRLVLPARPHRSRRARKHEGLSVLLVDMRTPGITVRPIDSMAGPHELNEIFFDDVRGAARLPARRAGPRLGRRHRGPHLRARRHRALRPRRARPRAAGRARDARPGWPAIPHVRQQLADLRVRYEAARLLSYRAISLQARGQVPTVEASIARAAQHPARAARRPRRARAARPARGSSRTTRRRRRSTAASGASGCATSRRRSRPARSRCRRTSSPGAASGCHGRADGPDARSRAGAARPVGPRLPRAALSARRTCARIEADAHGFDPELWREMAGLGWLGVDAAGGARWRRALRSSTRRSCSRRWAACCCRRRSSPRSCSRRRCCSRSAATRSGGAGCRASPPARRSPPSRSSSPAGATSGARRRSRRAADGSSGAKHFVPFAAHADVMLVAVRSERAARRWSPSSAARPGSSARGSRRSTASRSTRCSFAATPAQAVGRAGRREAALERARLARRGGVAGLHGRRRRARARDDRRVRPDAASSSGGRSAASRRSRIAASTCAATSTRSATSSTRRPGRSATGRDAALAVSAAKAYGNEALRRIFMHAHQVHGAIGFSTEHDLQLFTRRAKAAELAWGSATMHRERVARAMGL